MSKKNNKKVFSPTLSNVAVTPVALRNTTGYETDKELKVRLRREEEQAKREADPIYQHEQAMNKTYRELRKLSSEFWSRSIEEIAKELYSEGAKDVTFDAPVATQQYTLEQLQSAFATWFDTTLPPTGYELSQTGGQRLVRFGLAQAKLQKIDFSRPDVWNLAFLYVKDALKAFQPGDFDKEPQRVAGPAPKPTLADIERLNIEGDAEEARQARWIVNDLASSQFRPLVEEWLESLKTAFALYPTDAQMQKVVAWFRRNNAYWGDRRNYDRVRKYMILVEREWPESALTRQEILELEIEQSDLNDYGTRRSLLARTRS